MTDLMSESLKAQLDFWIGMVGRNDGDDGSGS
jgi:hypothetical protein